MSISSTSASAYDLQAFQTNLRTAAIGRTIHYKASIASTNTTAIALAQEGACHGTLVLADAQTAGRGRRGRHWYSPPGRNVYCSIILRLPAAQSSHLTIIPLASALAAADAIADTTAIQCRLKWPNDVLIGDKKVAGILCESVAGQPDTIVVVGIGINANSRPEQFPDDLSASVTTLIAARGSAIDRTSLLSILMNRLEERINQLSPETLPMLLKAYRTRCATLGQPVRVALSETDVIEGVAEAIGGDGSLQVRRHAQPGSGRPTRVVEVRSADIVHLRTMTDAGSMG